jgi:hypothetical protein
MRDNCMPGVKDVILASLFQDTSNDLYRKGQLIQGPTGKIKWKL